MGSHEKGPNKQGFQTCFDLLHRKPPVPTNTLFEDTVYERTGQMLSGRNEAKVIQDIARLIVPCVQAMALLGANHLDCLTESVNEGWNNAIPLTKPRPQPDYSIRFQYFAFTKDQMNKLQPFAGLVSPSLYKGTPYMYFPFFTSEVLCGAGELLIADRQNAHSMTLAVQGVVDLFRKVKREKEIHRELIAWSISHNEETAKIYGHYPVIDGANTTFHRHLIRIVNFYQPDSDERWVPYRFTMNLLEEWLPTHFKRLCSAIEDIPADLQFDMSTTSNLNFASPPGTSESSYIGSNSVMSNILGASDTPQRLTPETSCTRTSDRAPKGDYAKPKRPRR